MVADLAAEGKAQGGAPILVWPVVHAYQTRWLEMPGGFLACLADNGIENGFARLDVPGGLIDYALTSRYFLDHQESVVFSYNGGDRKFGMYHVRISAKRRRIGARV